MVSKYIDPDTGEVIEVGSQGRIDIPGENKEEPAGVLTMAPSEIPSKPSNNFIDPDTGEVISLDDASDAPATEKMPEEEKDYFRPKVSMDKIKEIASRYDKPVKDVVHWLTVYGLNPENVKSDRSLEDIVNDNSLSIEERTKQMIELTDQLAESEDIKRAEDTGQMAKVMNLSLAEIPKLISQSLAEGDSEKFHDELIQLKEEYRGKKIFLGSDVEDLMEMMVPLIPALNAIGKPAQLVASKLFKSKAAREGAGELAEAGASKMVKVVDLAKNYLSKAAGSMVTTGTIGGTASAAAAPSNKKAEAFVTGFGFTAMLPPIATLGAKGVGVVGQAVFDRLTRNKPPRFRAEIGSKAAENFTARVDSEKIVWDVIEKGREVTTEELAQLVKPLAVGERTIKNFAKKRGMPEEDAAKFLVTQKIQGVGTDFATNYLPAFAASKHLGDTFINRIRKIKTAEDIMNILPLAQQKMQKGTDTILKLLAEDGSPAAIKSAKKVIGRQIGQIVKNRKRELKDWEDVTHYIKEVFREKGQSSESMFKLWEGFRTNQEMVKIAKKELPSILPRSSVLAEGLNKASTSGHVMADIADRWGLNTSVINMRVNNTLERYKADSDMLITDYVQPFMTKFRKATSEITDWDSDLFYQLLDKPKVSLKGVSNTTASSMKYWAKEFRKLQTEGDDSLLSFVKQNADTTIDPKKFYVRHQPVKPDKAIHIVTTEFETVVKEMGDKLKGKAFRKTLKDNKRVKELVSTVKYLSGQADIPNLKVLRESVNTLLSDRAGVVKRLSPVAGSAMRRSSTREIPMLIREKDIGTLLTSWVNNTMKAAYLRDDVARLGGYVKFLEGLGDKNSVANQDATWLRDHISKLLGYDGGGKAAKLAEKWIDSPNAKRIYRKMGTSVGADMAMEAPWLVFDAARTMMYGNFLSSPKSWIRNTTQVAFLTGKEIGGSLGDEVVQEALAHSVMNPGKVFQVMRGYHKVTNPAMAEAIKKGKLPADMQSDITRSRFTLNTGKAAKLKEGARAYAKVTTWGFQASDKMNRVHTIYAADILAHKALKGNKDAIKYITEEIPWKDVRAKASEYLKREDYDKLSDILEDFLIQKTQFVYNTNQMAQFARDVGPALAMFSRWPTEVLGDMTNYFRQGQVGKAVEKYLGPLFYTTMLGGYLGYKATQDSEFKTRMEGLIGTGGVENWSPILSIANPIVNVFNLDMLERGPVMVDMMNSARDAITGDEHAARKFIDVYGKALLPGIRPTENLIDNFLLQGIMGVDEEPVHDIFQDWIGKPALKGHRGIRDIYNKKIKKPVSNSLGDLID